MIPKHFENAFPWIVKPKSNLKVYSKETMWLEKEIIRIIFNPVDKPLVEQDDNVLKLINSLKSECNDEAKQVEYIQAVAKCLAWAVIETPLPLANKDWLSEISKQAKSLSQLLKLISKNNLPSNWNNIFSISNEILDDIQLEKTPQRLELKKALKKANITIFKSGSGIHGNQDLVAVLNLLSKQSKELANSNAIKFYRYPQTFFSEISANKTLYLSYKRQAIKKIASLNQTHFKKTFDALTSHILSCVFQKEISNQSVKKIRENLNK